ncbi:ANTAR domain-containing protein [Streptomyces humi]|uniref:ANTAR domain-containing protein n=1 Tax=Streptomyces humi TaxID=1428620 RepID=UPI00062883EF|nr:ANTAR domain-containing protein [Streptomyces humi]
MLVQAGPTGDRVTVALSGEYCLDDGQTLQHALHDALGRSAAGVDLDLSGLAFADCSALNVLLAVRGQAAATGRTLTVTAVSPAAERLLTFTDTYALFTAPAVATDASHTAPERVLQTEVVQLRRALRTRPDIDLARGILMATFGLNAEQAWQALVLTSQHTNLKLHRLAEDVVTTVEGASLPEPVQRELTAAVSRVRGATGTEDTRETVPQARGR